MIPNSQEAAYTILQEGGLSSPSDLQTGILSLLLERQGQIVRRADIIDYVRTRGLSATTQRDSARTGLTNALAQVDRKLRQYSRQNHATSSYQLDRLRGVGIRLVVRESRPPYPSQQLLTDTEPTALLNTYSAMTGHELARGPPSELEIQIAQDHKFVAVMQRIRTIANDYYTRLGGTYLDEILSKR